MPNSDSYDQSSTESVVMWVMKPTHSGTRTFDDCDCDDMANRFQRNHNPFYMGIESMTMRLLHRTAVATSLDRIRCIITGYGTPLRVACLSAR